MKRILIFLSLLYLITCKSTRIQSDISWLPQLQSIPGRIQCEFYDRGGEGAAYHDADSINNGSGRLNPANGDSLNEFRMKEGVDISYTKGHYIDNNRYNQVDPLLNQVYVGWTQPGEWINYTISAKESGNYRVGLMYTANGEGAIGLDIDGTDVTGPLKILSTFNSADTVAWRQWHHWNRIDSIGSLKVSKGKHLLTLHVIEHGNMNFDFLEFERE